MSQDQPALEAFVRRWKAASGSERANYQLFLTELCTLLGLRAPDPASSDTAENGYVFERRVTFQEADGSESRGFIDLYKRGAFVLEAKQTGKPLDSGVWDTAMHRARAQAVRYASALPAEEGRPPFLVVTDVGRSIELYSEFSCTGGQYVAFPDPRTHRIRLEDLADEAVRDRLKRVWEEPLSLDPARRSARVTREIASKLAKLAKVLEEGENSPATVAAFLMRCIFTMFAEDVGLLAARSFTGLLESLRKDPQRFVPMIEELWRTMNAGGFSAALREDVLRFNGGLFADFSALPLGKPEIELLIEAARADWRHVEPAIFGTLLERALDPIERHDLGAHYTPRAYVERLVLPTVIEPLREEWTAVQAAALTLDRQNKRKRAVKEVRDFHQHLCHTRVLDPACGSGNFLYVALEHLKRLEGEVLGTLGELGQGQGLLEMEGITVGTHQLLGIEANPRAARIAETVLWIGYLQWHFRTFGNVQPPEPVLSDEHTIETRDAVLAWDRKEVVRDESGKPVTRWNGTTHKEHPVTGKQVPDESARVLLETYVRPRKAEWPEADYVVGNPPFIGTSRMRQSLGDGYAEALRATYPEVPESADYVLYWWHHAAELAREGKIRRFGFITTNSLRQTFNRRVVERQLTGKKPVSLRFAIPDHPWVDSSDGAAVRIAMTVAEAGERAGVLSVVTEEREGHGEGLEVELESTQGRIHADLTTGVDVTAAKALKANADLSNPGVKLHGAGFLVTREEAASLGLGRVPGLEKHIREYRNGRDITQRPRGVLVIDLFGLEAEQVRERFPEVYQWVLVRVKPERDQNKRESRRARWWLFGETNPKLRTQLADLSRYIATVETSKHRFFVFLDRSILPDNMLVNVALADAYFLGVVSSRIHLSWALATGGTLEDRPRYNKTRCFETFPFPNPIDEMTECIGRLAEQLDAHRKRQQALHPDLTMTGMYNVLEKLRAGEALIEKEKQDHERGLVSVLRQLHDDLDAAVFDAYGWPRDLSDEDILRELVKLNLERAAEERNNGLVRWLRPAYQNPGGAGAVQATVPLEHEPGAAEAKAKQPWPKALAAQVRCVRAALEALPAPASAEALAREFQRARSDRIGEILETLESLGQARRTDAGLYAAG